MAHTGTGEAVRPPNRRSNIHAAKTVEPLAETPAETAGFFVGDAVMLKPRAR